MAMPSRPCVVLTREPEDNEPLARCLRADGASVREIPCVGTRYVEGVCIPTGVAAVLFASKRAVRGFSRMRGARDLLAGDGSPVPTRTPFGSRAQTGAVGPGTAEALRECGFPVDHVADPPEGQALAALAGRLLPPGARVLVPRGDLDGGALEPALREQGLDVQARVVYENFAPSIPEEAPFPVAVIFTASPSAARRLLQGMPWMVQAPFVCIGRTTRIALVELGVKRIQEMGANPEDWHTILKAATQGVPDQNDTGPLKRGPAP